MAKSTTSGPTTARPVKEKKKKTWQRVFKRVLLFYIISSLLLQLILWTVAFYLVNRSGIEIKSSEQKNLCPKKQEANIFKALFFDDKSGVEATDRVVRITSDGGKTWSDLLVIKNVPVFEIWVIDRITVQDSQNMSIRLRGATNDLIETSDGGQTWEYVLYHTSHYGSRKVKMRTQDRGQNWQQIKEQS